MTDHKLIRRVWKEYWVTERDQHGDAVDTNIFNHKRRALRYALVARLRPLNEVVMIEVEEASCSADENYTVQKNLCREFTTIHVLNCDWRADGENS